MKKIPLKAKIIKYVCEQGIVSVEDLADQFRSESSMGSFRVMMYQIGFTRIKFENVKYGVWCIQDPKLLDVLKKYYPELPHFQIRDASMYRIPHSLGLNYIRRTYERMKQLSIIEWWSEEYIRALPYEERQEISLRWCPDAVFWRLKNGNAKQKIFVEYERTYKNIKRYALIFRSYEKRKDVGRKSVLYICEDEKIMRRLVRTYRKLLDGGKLRKEELFQFTTLSDFNKIKIKSRKERKG